MSSEAEREKSFFFSSFIEVKCKAKSSVKCEDLTIELIATKSIKVARESREWGR